MATSRRMELPIVTASTLQPERAAWPMSGQLVWRWRLANPVAFGTASRSLAGRPGLWIWLGGKRPRLLPTRRTVVLIGGFERSLW